MPREGTCPRSGTRSTPAGCAPSRRSEGCPLLAEACGVSLSERRRLRRTPDVVGPIACGLMARDAIAFTEVVVLSSAHLVGRSGSAVVGLPVALCRPDLVRPLVLLGQNGNRERLRPKALGMTKPESMPDVPPPMPPDAYAAVFPDGPAHRDGVVDQVWQTIRTEPNVALGEQGNLSAQTRSRSPSTISRPSSTPRRCGGR